MSETNSTITAKEAKAEAKASKARAKALRPWYKKPSRIVPLALVAVIGFAVATSNGGDDTNTTDAAADTSTSAPANEEAESAAKVGDTVRDGKFEFTVTNVETGVAEVGTNELLTEEAQGEYTLVSMKIENIGDEAQTFFVDNVKGVDSEDREVSSDSTGTLYANEGSDAWMSEINPGNSIEAVVVFDIAKGATLDQVVLQDSMLSGGVTVEL